MPRRVGPVRPRLKDAKEYEAMLREQYLDPIVARLRFQLAQVAAVNEAYAVLTQAEANWAAAPTHGIPREAIATQLAALDGYHRDKLIQTFRTALGVDIRPLLTEPAIAAFMTERIAENVDLVKTIPPRLHEDLKRRIEKEFRDKPFDQATLRRVFKESYGLSGYNLRRITRDQGNKLVGGLTEVRHGQLGINQYRWGTARDERVRPEHAFNEGRVFDWDDPPSTDHPGYSINCRCVAYPIVTQSVKDKLA